MKQQDSPVDKLNRIIKETCARLLTYTEPSARDAGDTVLAEHPSLIREAGYEFARQKVYDKCGDALRQSVHPEGCEQGVLAFAIPHLPNALSFEGRKGKKTEIRFIATRRATKEHLLSHRLILRGQIANDTRTLNAVDALYEQCLPYFNTHPGITVEAAEKLYKDDHRGDQPDDSQPYV
jgi:hypothetical protein